MRLWLCAASTHCWVFLLHRSSSSSAAAILLRCGKLSGCDSFTVFFFHSTFSAWKIVRLSPWLCYVLCSTLLCFALLCHCISVDDEFDARSSVHFPIVQLYNMNRPLFFPLVLCLPFAGWFNTHTCTHALTATGCSIDFYSTFLAHTQTVLIVLCVDRRSRTLAP